MNNQTSAPNFESIPNAHFPHHRPSPWPRLRRRASSAIFTKVPIPGDVGVLQLHRQTTSDLGGEQSWIGCLYDLQLFPILY